MSSSLKYDKANIELRRGRVLDLLAQGLSQNQIATQLNVSSATVSLDVQYLEESAKDNIEKHIHETLPMQYAKVMNGLHQVLGKTWEVVNKEHLDDKTRLQSLALVNDCYKLIMELSSDASVIKQAISFVNRRLQSQTPTKQEEDQVIEDLQNQGEEEAVEEEEVIE